MELPIELELELSRIEGDHYRIVTRVSNPFVDQMPQAQPGELRLRVAELTVLAEAGDIPKYARLLSEDFFGGDDGLIRRRFDEARSLAAHHHTDIRLRLLIDEGAPQLDAVLWETLINPASAESAPLCVAPDVFFSRVLQRVRPRQFTLRQKHQLRVLVVIANPAPPEGVKALHPVNVDKEVERARAGLSQIAVEVLTTLPGTPGVASLERIIRELDKPYDALYLVCHGSVDATLGDTRLHLENAAGGLDRVTGKELVTRIERLPAPPNLIILCACESAGPMVPVPTLNGDPGAPVPNVGPSVAPASSDRVLTAMGPRLVRAGIPAVVAMQGPIRMETAGKFFTAFFAELMKTGIVDRSMSIARATIERLPDYFAPVLFQRTRSGRLWYGTVADQPGVSGINWTGLVADIRDGNGTVLLGSALLDEYIGAVSEVATQLAQKHDYPFGDTERDDLAMVGEYLASALGRNNLQNAVIREWLRRLLGEYSGTMPELLGGQTVDRTVDAPQPELTLARSLQIVWNHRSSRPGATDVFQALARIPFRAYISTNPDTLVEEALKARGVADPIIWSLGRNRGRRSATARAPYTQARPLVSYLYGTIKDPDSLVLTEDDYYNQLVTAARGEGPMTPLNTIFTSSSLIFLGFRLHEWDFRVLFRRLKLIGGWKKHESFNHVAVQIDSTSTRGTASEQTVKRYLKHFFDSPKIEIYRGSAAAFVNELQQRCVAAGVPLRGNGHV